MSDRAPQSTMATDRDHARSLDAVDPLAGYRAQFVHPQGLGGQPVTYLLGNSLGLMPRSAQEAVEEELARWGSLAIAGHFRGQAPWFRYHESFRASSAAVVGARPEEVVTMNSLTVNLHLMLVSFYRPQGTRTKILMEAGAFSSDRYAVASQLEWHGLDPADTIIVAQPRGGEATLRTEDLEGLLAERGQEIALIMLSGINYLTGQRFDLQRITDAGKAQGCTVGFDLAHSAGNVPHALHDWDVDFAVWCTYKYLNGGPGAVAGCFVHERHAHRTDLPRLAGWWGNDPDIRFEMRPRFEPDAGADGWQISNAPILSAAPVRASLALFEEAGLEVLRAKSIQLTGYLEGLLHGVGTGRVEILTPTDPEARGCQLSLKVLGGAQAVFESLSQRGIVVDFREPDVIRAAPVPFYNSFEDAWVFVDALRDALGS